MTTHASRLTPATTEAVLERLGFAAAAALDADGLRRVYQAWCRSVPFDNVRKLIVLHGEPGAPLPGMDAEEFFAAWLRHGCGGTCWPTAGALDALLAAIGFDSRLVAASMGDAGVPTHGTTIVTIESTEWLVDSSMLTDVPLALTHTEGTAIDHPVFGTQATPVDEGWLFAFALPFAEATMPCRTMSADGVDHAFCAERYEVSRESSPFNQRVSTRRNNEAGVVSYGGGKRYRRSATGVEETDLDGAELRAALVEELGMSEEIVDRLAAVLG